MRYRNQNLWIVLVFILLVFGCDNVNIRENHSEDIEIAEEFGGKFYRLIGEQKFKECANLIREDQRQQGMKVFEYINETFGNLESVELVQIKTHRKERKKLVILKCVFECKANYEKGVITEILEVEGMKRTLRLWLTQLKKNSNHLGKYV